MEHPRFFVFLFRYSSYSRYSLSYLCGNKRYHQPQAGCDADGNAETGSLSKPSDNRRSYQETEETDARNDGNGDARLDGSQFSGDTVTDRNRRRDAETYQQETQGGRNEIRQGSSQPQTAQYQTTTNLQYSGWAVFRNKPISHESTQRHRTHTSHIARTDKSLIGFYY